MYLLVVWMFILSFTMGGPTGTVILIDEGKVCFRRSNYGRKLERKFVRSSHDVTNLEACQLICARESSFDCKGFNFKKQKNTSILKCELISENGRIGITLSSEDKDAVFYEKIGRGNECQKDTGFSDRVLFTYGSPSQDYLYLDHHKPELKSTNGCFQKIKEKHRLSGFLTRESLRVKSINECEEECMETKRFNCQLFSYQSTTKIDSEHNCQLSDKSSRTVSLFQNSIYDSDSNIHEKTSSNCINQKISSSTNRSNYPGYSLDKSRCFKKTRAGIRIIPGVIKKTAKVNLPADCEEECLKVKIFRCKSFAFRYFTSKYKNSDNCELSDVDVGWSTFYLTENRDYDTWYRTDFSTNCNAGSDDVESISIDRSDVNDVSASGVDCISRCQENKNMGYWFCDIDDRGAWDYCCSPSSKCGYSEGQPIPWCYVGLSGRNQWRPCSEKYAERRLAYLRMPESNSSTHLAALTDLSDSVEVKKSDKYTSLQSKEKK
ncbi:uncharacterized protein LOC136036511 isoform X2 [Artemia franciscana]|uniref:uncharacterized protein LOC136036511 isoform X2 n=1 Tax=Artemia franciscana TaxID=6661 RepID=UPI0032DBB0B6